MLRATATLCFLRADYFPSEEFAALVVSKHGAGTWMPCMVLPYMGLSIAFVFPNFAKIINLGTILNFYYVLPPLKYFLSEF